MIIKVELYDKVFYMLKSQYGIFSSCLAKINSNAWLEHRAVHTVNIPDSAIQDCQTILQEISYENNKNREPRKLSNL